MKRKILMAGAFMLITVSMTNHSFASEIFSKTDNMFAGEDPITLESEHPPLSEDTKKAIAVYKSNPCEQTKQGVLQALNEAYDIVVQTKKENLEKYTLDREERIDRWMHTILSGKLPPFMSLEGDGKEEERQAVEDAANQYFEDPSEEKKAQVLEAFERYYDAFLKEQEDHLAETEEMREERIADSLEYFISDQFQPHISQKNSAGLEDVLAEIICNYISMGAEILPVNPEARVTEREFNTAILEAQTAYLETSSKETEAVLRDAVTEAFQTAYDVRMEGWSNAEQKGDEAAEALLHKMTDASFLENQYIELTEQRNLYGRIDRIITFGSNTYGNWTPRMSTESNEFALLLEEYKAFPTAENEQALQEQFYDLYYDMLSLQKTHLDEVQLNLDLLADQMVQELQE